MALSNKERREKYRFAYDALMQFYPLTIEDLDGEIWKDIVGYEGDYQESNFGRTKSFKRRKVTILKPCLQSNGYLHVDLFQNGKSKIKMVHKLVAETFIPNPEGKPEVNHLDGNKLNCHFSNLVWATSSENKRHAIQIGLQKSGAQHTKAKLTDEQVKFIRNFHISGDKKFGARALAKTFGVSKTAIKFIVEGKTYRNSGVD